jgi:hypothetical protein
MHNNRRGFVIGGAAGLTALLAPNVAQACFCRRCRRAAAQVPALALPAALPYSTHLTPSSMHCPINFAWSSTPPSIPDATNMTANAPHSFTLTGTGLYTCFVGGSTFVASIVDNAVDTRVVWGSYNYPAVTQGSSGNPDSFKFFATETGSTAGTSSTITITVSLSLPYALCPGITWSNIPITYR